MTNEERKLVEELLKTVEEASFGYLAVVEEVKKQLVKLKTNVDKAKTLVSNIRSVNS